VTIPPELLCGRWLHAHEEDTEHEMVFRPAAARFPPSRGRRGLELSADGSYAELHPGPDDRTQRSPGRWALEADDWLVLEPGPGGSRRALRIVVADGEAIVVCKPEPG
jgi:hypothetical protein